MDYWEYLTIIERADRMDFTRQVLGEPLGDYCPKEILRNIREERELTMPFKSSTMHFDCKGFSWNVVSVPEIKNVIFNNPATIVFWEDGTKTVVKCENEEFDKEKGLAMACMKKMLGNKGRYFNEVKKWTR